jgi:hypothetical protein
MHARARQNRTERLQLAPQLALLAADAVHDARDVLERALQLRQELGAAGALPQAALVKRHGARGEHGRVGELLVF